MTLSTPQLTRSEAEELAAHVTATVLAAFKEHEPQPIQYSRGDESRHFFVTVPRLVGLSEDMLDNSVGSEFYKSVSRELLRVHSIEATLLTQGNNFTGTVRVQAAVPI